MSRYRSNTCRSCFVRLSEPYDWRCWIGHEESHIADVVRDSRIELRVARSEKEVIERAAAMSGSSMTDFVRSTMLAASERAVRAHEALALTSEGAAAFVEAITNPPEPCGPAPGRRA